MDMKLDIVGLFPGQGSQSPGMGKFLFDQFSVARETFEEASDALSLNLKKLCFEADMKELSLTANTQPALLTTSTATFRVLQKEFDVKFKMTAGHSIGEYGSFVLSEAMSFTDAVRAVRLRGESMQSAVPVGQGGMAAVLGLEDEQVVKICELVSERTQSVLQAANFNCPGQVVISGSVAAIDHLKNDFQVADHFPEIKKIKLIPLQVSAPFHCDLMKPAEDTMRALLTGTKIHDAKTPILQNFTARVETKSSVLRENLIRQVSGSVRWTQSMKVLLEQDLTTCIELGHGQVLSGLLKKIDSSRFRVFNTSNLEDLEKIENFLKTGV
jgi:[acyl-carrier-protein] S-malonyltransferase